MTRDYLVKRLTDRQLEILRAVAESGGTKAAQKRLGVTANTINNSLNFMRLKTGAETTMQLVSLAYRFGLLPSEGNASVVE